MKIKMKRKLTCSIKHQKFRGKMCLPYRTYQNRYCFADSPKSNFDISLQNICGKCKKCV